MISLIASAIRTQFWMGFYNSLIGNNIPFEVIFVGNHTPNFALPDNFRFIYSEVKPAQCFEIAARSAQGDFIVIASDDYEFSDHALDKLYEKHCYYNSCRFSTLVSCRYMINGRVSDESLFYLHGTKSPPTEMCALWPTQTFCDLGGADRRFIALYWNVDLTMRFFELGGELKYVEDAFVREITLHSLVGFPRLHHLEWPKIDRGFLDSLWMKNGTMLTKRALPLEPFDDKDILTVSQGNKGVWT